VQKGSTTIKTLYYEKDIRFLLHEPIVWKFREFKVFLRKLKKAKEKGNTETVDRLNDNKPKYSLDHIVKERYPTFIDAIRDLEDCLCLAFLYGTFPKTARTPKEMVELCRRLVVEFMHYVIESRGLRKVFCSIKGYYFQADIKGQLITWIMPHKFAHQNHTSVDMKLMSVFAEFYTTMLGFINFRLFNGLNLTYPPKLVGCDAPGKLDEENVAALNQSLQRTVMPDEVPELDVIPMTDDSTAIEAARKEAEAVERQSKLFNGLKFFIGREVPREPIVFMIRCMGGEVSWNSTVALGSTYEEDDDRITHQIADREVIPNKKLGRFYTQPQWIFDSINQRKRLNEKDYALGETLPPHLSPFIAERRIGDYIPPEEKALEEQKQKEKDDEDAEDQDDDEEDEEDDEEDEEEEDEDDEDDEDDEEDGEEEEDEEAEDEGESEVKVSTRVKVDKETAKKMTEEEEFRLREMMVPRKHRGLYKSMMKGRKRRTNQAKYLERKRKAWDEENAPPANKKKKKSLSKTTDAE